MQSKSRIFDDAARLAGGALGTLAGIRREVEALVRQQFERFLDGMELVTREEFEAVKAMAAKARSEQERLEARVDELAARLAARGAEKPRAAKGSSRRTPARGGKRGGGAKSAKT